MNKISSRSQPCLSLTRRSCPIMKSPWCFLSVTVLKEKFQLGVYKEPGKLQSMRLLRSWTWLSDFTFTFHFHVLEKEVATHSSVLAWRIPGMGEPGRLPSMGSHRVGHDWSDLAAAAAATRETKAIITGGWGGRCYNPESQVVQELYNKTSVSVGKKPDSESQQCWTEKGGPGSQPPHSGPQVHLTFGPFRVCCSHAFRETNSLRRTMQIAECSLWHRGAQGRLSS